MSTKLLKEFVNETLNEISFIDHLKNGLSFCRGDRNSEAYQIAQDYLEEVELKMGTLLHPGHVSRIERFVVNNWPDILEQYRGNSKLALIAMTNLLDAKLQDLK